MTTLILANETIGGKALLDEVLRRRDESDGDVRFHVVVPKTRPRHGNVIYDEAVRDGAQVRVDLMLSFMREEGIEATGDVGDEDPFNAALDAMHDHEIDEIVVSTLPATASGWLRRDIIERLREETGLPVEHVVVDLARHGYPFHVTLVVANLTATSPELTQRLRQLGEEEPRRYIVVVPQESTEGSAVTQARERLGTLLESLEQDGFVAAGMIGDPDPYTATMNAVQFFNISEIVISTLPEDSSKWVCEKLVDRVRTATNKPVEHVESSEPAGAGTPSAGAGAES